MATGSKFAAILRDALPSVALLWMRAVNRRAGNAMRSRRRAHPRPLPLGARACEQIARMTAKQPLVLAWRGLGADARTAEQREGDDGDLPQIDLDQLAHARCRIDARLRGAKADREPVDRAGAQQREQLAP